MRAFLSNPYNFPLFLWLLTFIAHGTLLPWLGFYMDDWSLLWLAETQGDLSPFLQYNRPWLIPVYSFLIEILGANTLLWHALLCMLKYLGALAVWYLMGNFFPKRNYLAAIISIFYLLYPAHLVAFHPLGFLFQYLQVLLLWASLILQIEAIQTQKRRFLLLSTSLLLALSNLVVSEYYFFFELARPLLLFLFLNTKGNRPSIKQNLKQSLRYSASFLFVFFGISLWKWQAPQLLSRYSTELVTAQLADPFFSASKFINRFPHDLWVSTIQPVMYAFHPKDLLEYTKQTDFISHFLITAVLCLAVFLYLHFLEKNDGESKKQNNSLAIVLIGSGFALLCAAFLPFWLGNLAFSIGFDIRSRYLLPCALGASLIWAGILEIAAFRKQLKTLLPAILVGFLASTQLLAMNAYKHERQKLQNILWQIAIRIPDLPANTIILSNKLPMHMVSENSLSAILDWIYADTTERGTTDYYWYFELDRFQDEVGSMDVGKTHSMSHLIGLFEARSSDVLAWFFTPSGCLHVLEPDIAVYDSDAPAALQEVAEKSTFDYRVLSSVSDPIHEETLENLFGRENEKDWCSYYQYAMAATQQGDMQTASGFFEKAFAQNLYPQEISEWLTVVKTLALNGKESEAAFWTNILIRSDSSLEKDFCAIWLNIANLTKTDSAKPSMISSILAELGCTY